MTSTAELRSITAWSPAQSPEPHVASSRPRHSFSPCSQQEEADDGQPYTPPRKKAGRMEDIPGEEDEAAHSSASKKSGRAPEDKSPAMRKMTRQPEALDLSVIGASMERQAEVLSRALAGKNDSSGLAWEYMREEAARKAEETERREKREDEWRREEAARRAQEEERREKREDDRLKMILSFMEKMSKP